MEVGKINVDKDMMILAMVIMTMMVTCKMIQ